MSGSVERRSEEEGETISAQARNLSRACNPLTEGLGQAVRQVKRSGEEESSVDRNVACSGGGPSVGLPLRTVTRQVEILVCRKG